MYPVKKSLVYDVMHLQRQPDIIYRNDAKSSYDGIVQFVLNMEMKRLRMPAYPTKCMVGTL